MRNNSKSLKAIVLSLALAAGMLLPAVGYAQENGKWGGGLFGRGATEESDWLRGLFGLQEEAEEGDIENYGIGQEAPLGSGMFIMLAAGLGYWGIKLIRKRRTSNEKNDLYCDGLGFGAGPRAVQEGITNFSKRN